MSDVKVILLLIFVALMVRVIDVDLENIAKEIKKLRGAGRQS